MLRAMNKRAMLKGRHVTKPFYNDASHSYGPDFVRAKFCPPLPSKGVHLSATGGSNGPFVERLTVDSDWSDLGYSVSVDGNTAVVGLRDENNRGSAYVFTRWWGVDRNGQVSTPTAGKAKSGILWLWMASL